MAQNDAVKFVFIPVGEPIPEQKEEGTIYFCAEGQKLYVGDNLIANAGGGGSGDIDIEINGEGDYIASAGFSNNVLTLTKSSLYDAVDNAGFATESYVDEAISSAVPESFVLEVDKPPQSVRSGQYLYDIEGSSNPLTLEGLYQNFGSIASGDEALVTGGIVYSAISNLVSADYIDSAVSSAISSAMSSLTESVVMTSDISAIFGKLVPNTGDYLTSIVFVGCSAGDYFLTETASFGSITSTSSTAVTGSIVYSAISSAISELNFLTDVTTGESANISARYLYDIYADSDTGVITALYSSFDSITSSSTSPVTGSTLYSEVLLQSNINMTYEIGTYGLSYYIYDVNRGSNNNGIYVNYAPYGSILSGNNQLVTGGIVYSAISNLVSADYVSNAISSATSDFITMSDVADAILMISASNSGQYLFSACTNSDTGKIEFLYDTFGSIGDGNKPVTGDAVRSALDSYYSRADFNVNISAGDDYVHSVFFDHSGVLQFMLDDFASSITSNGSTPVTGSAVYSGIRDALADAASFQSISSRTIGDTFLYTMHIPSNAADSYILYEAHVGQVTSSEQFFVPGSAIYSAISGLTSKGYVDDAISSIYSMLDSDYATILYVNSAISNAISNVDSSIGDAINYLIGDSSPLLEESGIMNSVIDSFNLASESYVQSYTQDYLSSIITYDHSWDYVNIERDNNTLVYTFNPATFGPIASDAHNAVAGSTIYSAIAAIPTIPSYSAADEGKVLKIVNGEPAWVSI